MATVCEFTLHYFINTNEYRHSSRRDMWSYVAPERIQLDEDGNDNRSIDQQMGGLMDDWASMTAELVVKSE